MGMAKNQPSLLNATKEYKLKDEREGTYASC